VAPALLISETTLRLQNRNIAPQVTDTYTFAANGSTIWKSPLLPHDPILDKFYPIDHLSLDAIITFFLFGFISLGFSFSAYWHNVFLLKVFFVFMAFTLAKAI
jgi:hypothetical protein